MEVVQVSLRNNFKCVTNFTSCFEHIESEESISSEDEEEDAEEEYIQQASGQPLTTEQRKSMQSQCSSEILTTLIATLQKAKIPFCIAGSFSAFTVDRLNAFNDIDVFINSDSVHSLPRFKHKPSRKGTEYWNHLQDTRKNRPEDYFNIKKNFKLKINDVIKYCPIFDRPKTPTDYVFASNPKCRTSLAYSLFVLRHFDLQAARVALFNPFRKQPALYHYHTLTTPSFADISPARMEKYGTRFVNMTPSPLSTLCLNSLIDSRLIDHDYDSSDDDE